MVAPRRTARMQSVASPFHSYLGLRLAAVRPAPVTVVACPIHLCARAPVVVSVSDSPLEPSCPYHLLASVVAAYSRSRSPCTGAASPPRAVRPRRRNPCASGRPAGPHAGSPGGRASAPCVAPHCLGAPFASPRLPSTTVGAAVAAEATVATVADVVAVADVPGGHVRGLCVRAGALRGRVGGRRLASRVRVPVRRAPVPLVRADVLCAF